MILINISQVQNPDTRIATNVYTIHYKVNSKENKSRKYQVKSSNIYLKLGVLLPDPV